MTDIEIVPRQCSIYIKEGERTIASCQVFTYLDRGYMYSILGKEFLIAMPEIIEEIKELGINSLEGPMIPAVARAVRLGLKGIAKVTLTNIGEQANGIKMTYCLVEF